LSKKKENSQSTAGAALGRPSYPEVVKTSELIFQEGEIRIKQKLQCNSVLHLYIMNECDQA
jgi:hypothetical protein